MIDNSINGNSFSRTLKIDHNTLGYFPTPLDLVIITEFSDWLWKHILASFIKKIESNKDSESLADLLSGTTVAILWQTLQK